MENLLETFIAKVDTEDIFKPKNGNESSHDNTIRVVSFAKYKNLTVKSIIFPHHNIHKYTWTSLDSKTNKQIDHILIG
jgi:hypothetical protein